MKMMLPIKLKAHCVLNRLEPTQEFSAKGCRK